MAKKFATDKKDMFVMGYASRPVLHIKPKSGSHGMLWLSFSDALLKYGSGLREVDLGDAYRKAGVAFRGQLQQNFVVLHETTEKQTKDRNPLIANNLNSGTPKKRAREETDQEPEPKNQRNNAK